VVARRADEDTPNASLETSEVSANDSCHRVRFKPNNDAIYFDGFSLVEFPSAQILPPNIEKHTTLYRSTQGPNASTNRLKSAKNRESSRKLFFGFEIAWPEHLIQ
jgi:hypothetical protein